MSKYLTQENEYMPRCLDLFSGAGGLSLGLKWAGWDIIGSVEANKWAAATYWNNFSPACVIQADIRDLNFEHMYGLDLVVGGPPCQPFSVAGKQLADSDQRDMVPEFIRVIREIRPKAFLMENVPGLLSKRHELYFDRIIQELSDLDYHVTPKVLDAACYGVPQHRKRVFIIGESDACSAKFEFPSPTHGPGTKNSFIASKHFVTREPKGAPNNAKVYYAKKPVFRPSPWAGMLVNGKGRPINLEEPSRTIPASTGGNRTHIVDFDGILEDYHKHLSENGKPRSGIVEGVRRLTICESASLQSFPDKFVFVGPNTTQYGLIGNAVPPLLAYAIASSLIAIVR